VDRILAKLEANIASGAVILAPADWPGIPSLAERLSAKTHTGRRTSHLGRAPRRHDPASAREILTFDANQAALARAEGLKALPKSGR
jgi:hypothetical protein